MLSFHNYAYWAGYAAATGTYTACTYTDPALQVEWSKGFAKGVAEKRAKAAEIESDEEEEKLAKLWYRSRTMIIGLIMLVCGIGVMLYGYYSKQPALMGSGGTLTGSSIIMTALRALTSSALCMTSAGQYAPPP